MRIKKQKDDMAKGDLTPMIDMTFQLIAFFMVIVNFSQQEQTEAILLPDSSLAKPPETQPDYSVTLNLKKDDEVLLRGVPYSIDALGLELRQSKNVAASQGYTADKITVIIRAHKDARTGIVQKLIGACQAEGLDNFKLRVKEKAGYAAEFD